MLAKPRAVSWWKSHNASLHQTQGGSETPPVELSRPAPLHDDQGFASNRDSPSNVLLPILATLRSVSFMEQGESVASLLRELRHRKGHTLRFAATELGVAPSQLSRMERGERPVGAEAAQQLARYYSVSLEEIVVAHGQLPEDIVQILQSHPAEISRLRAKYKV